MTRQFHSRYGWWIVILLAPLFPLGYWGMEMAFQHANNNVSQWLPEDYPETQTYQAFQRRFGSDNFALVSWEGCTLDDPRLETLARALVPSEETRDDDTRWFASVLTGPRAMEALMSGPFQLSRHEALNRLAGTLIGPDGRTTCAVITLSKEGDAARTKALAALERIAKRSCGLEPEELRLGGDAVINAAIDIASEQAINKWIGVSVAIALACAWLSLRRVALMGMVFVVSVYSAVLGTGLIYYTGGTMNLLLVLIPVLLYVLSLSASVHLANYYADAVHESGLEGAGFHALARGWLPCTLSSVTTALGLGSLCVSHLRPVKMFGVYSSVGVLLSLGILFLLLPALMELRRVPMPVEEESADQKPVARRRHRHPVASLVEFLGSVVVRHHRVAAVSSLSLLVGLGVGLLWLKTAVQPSRFFPEKSKWIQDSRWLGEHLGPLVTIEVLLAVDNQSPHTTLQELELVEAVAAEMETVPEVGATISAATFAPSLDTSASADGETVSGGGGIMLKMLGMDDPTAIRRRVLNQRLERNRDVFVEHHYLAQTPTETLWRITARAAASREANYDQTLLAIRRQVESFLASHPQASEGVRTVFTGSAPLVFVAQRDLLRGLVRSFALAFVMITVVMMVLLQSASAGLLSMLPNIFPVVTAFGTMAWLGMPVDVGAMMTASVALGIAVDDTLHYLTWFRRAQRATGSRREAVIEAYHRCALAMTQTTFITAPALLVFFFSSFQPVSQFGLLMFVLLLAALVGDLVLLPALLVSRLGASFSPRDVSDSLDEGQDSIQRETVPGSTGTLR